jgi:hypothetical protein
MHRGNLSAGGRSGSRRWAGSAAAVVFALAVATAAAFSGNDQASSKSDPLTPTASPASRIRDSFFDLRFSMRGVQQAASLSEIKLAKVLFAPKPTYESDNRLVETDVAQAEPEAAPVEPAQTVATAVPLPRPRPTEANSVASVLPRDVVRAIESDRTDDPTILDKLSGMFKYRLTLASLAPGDGIFAPKLDLASLGYDNETAVYDISSHAVYLPNGAKFEAHSGLGEARDDLSHVSEHKVGPTPPAVYDLKPREALFHGVQALRMNPVEGSALGRTGLLVHSYMLGPNGDSNGCVSVKDYDRFLAAYQRGDFKRLAVVPNIAAMAKQSSL